MSKLADPLIKVAIPLSKNVLARLGITAAASAIHAGIKKKTTKNETKEQKGGFLSMLLVTLGASLLGNI